eukprot:TRINITY_DN8943_c0_g2_i1.p1 TRINITY_DN8943_c0_g2~~TRINITY_DN8943_c0_g2_i1.p1  ORF type:complete len:204 (-),score=50.03 TRINITY_DN8943_c0_g2_i1:25-636(-)
MRLRTSSVFLQLLLYLMSCSLADPGGGGSSAAPKYLSELQAWKSGQVLGDGGRSRRDASPGNRGTTWWKKFFNFGNKKSAEDANSIHSVVNQSADSQTLHSFSSQPQQLPASNRRNSLPRPAKLAGSKGLPGNKRVRRPPGEQPAGVSNLTRMLGGFLPNTYFSRPRFRYPYYDRNGKGYLLYGYGEKDLYEYSVFKPLEGYY